MLKHQESELARARDLEVDLHRIASVVRQVNPSRYAQLADKVEGRVRGPLLEMLYHAAMVSNKDLYSLFVQFIQEWENRAVSCCASHCCMPLAATCKRWIRPRKT